MLKEEQAYMVNKIVKVPSLYLLTPTLLPRLFFEPIVSVTLEFSTLSKKTLPILFFKIMGGSLITNTVSLSKPVLKVINSNYCLWNSKKGKLSRWLRRRYER